MLIEALQLLKDQLSDRFIDNYEAFQSLFTMNLVSSEAPHSQHRYIGDMVDDEYTLYPESNHMSGTYNT